MKKALKRLSAAILALAMIASLTPVTGGTILADEAETDAPAATEEPKETEVKNTQAPKETSKPADETPKKPYKADEEAPSETEKPKAETPKDTEKIEPEETDKPAPQETEEPEPEETPAETTKPADETPEETIKPETEAPAETGTDKTPSETATKAPKNDITRGTINAKISEDGILTWEPYENAEEYYIEISDRGLEVKSDSYDLKKAIDKLIKAAEITKSGTYPVVLQAYNSEGEIIADWNDDFEYNSSAVANQFDVISASIAGGILKWSTVNGASYYSVYIEDDNWAESYGKTCYINNAIDLLIKKGKLEKKSPYKVELYAYDEDNIIFAKFSENYTYNSTAEPIKVGEIAANISDSGVLTWNPYEGANHYTVTIDYSQINAARSPIELKKEIDKRIKADKLDKKSSYSITINAYDSDYLQIAKWTKDFKYTSSATQGQLDTITNISISENGIMTWDAVEDAEDYRIYISGYDYSKYASSTSFEINANIDKLIKAGDLVNKGSYTITIRAFDKDDIIMAEGTKGHTYTSTVNPIVVTTLTNVSVSEDGILTWDKVENAYSSSIRVNNEWIDSDTDSAELHKEIDKLIRRGELINSSSYTVKITIYDEDDLTIAEWSGPIAYSSKAKPVEVGAITGVSVSSAGIMTWNPYEGADEYKIYIYDESVYTDETSFDLFKKIDYLIKAGRIYKSSPYSIMIEAYDKDYIKLAEYSFTQPYNSEAKPVQVGKISNINIKDRVLTWSAYSGATKYSVVITDCTDNDYWFSDETTSFNVDDAIDRMIKKGVFVNKSPYSIEIFAYDKDGIKLAAGTIEHDYTSLVEPIKVGTIKGAAISPDGILTWEPYPDAYEYTVYIGSSGERFKRTSYDVNKEIDRSIRAGFLKKSGTYSIRIVAEDIDDIKLAEWKYDYVYNSPAEPVVIVPITNAQVSNGILTWDHVNDVYEYVVEINKFNRYLTTESLDLHEAIDKLIKGGDIIKGSSYKIKITAYNSEWIKVAECSFDHQYDSKATPINVGKISGVKFSKGVMTWKNYSGATTYCVYIYDCSVYCTSAKLNVNSKIDWYIKAGYINKSSPYPITIIAFDKEGYRIAEWSGNYKYSSTATKIDRGTISNINISDKGKMSWTAYKGTKTYTISVDDSWYSMTSNTNSFDVNDLVSNLINWKMIDKQDYYNVFVTASNSENIVIAEGSAIYSYSSTDISGSATVSDPVDKIFTGKPIEQNPVVKLGETTLVKGVDYNIYYNDNYNAGTVTMTIGFKGSYIGTISKTFKIEKAANPLSLKSKTTKVKYKKVKKKNLTYSIASLVKMKAGNDPKIYKKLKGNKKILIIATTGKVTIKKKLKKGTYKIKVQITALGNNNYEPAANAKTVTFKIKVK